MEQTEPHVAAQTPNANVPKNEHDFKADHMFTYILPPVTGLVTLYVEKENADSRYHAFQSTLLGILFLSALVLLAVLLPDQISSYLLTALKMAFFGVWLYCVWAAYSNKKIALPYIGKLAHKLAHQNAENL